MLGGMVNVKVEVGNVALQEVDAVVNPANKRMRGDFGAQSVESAIYAASGPQLAAHVRKAFPDGLSVGETGTTPGFDLPAGHIVHVVVPRHQQHQEGSEALVAAYEKSLQAASDVGAQSLALPILGAGFNGWPLEVSVKAALEALRSLPPQLSEVTLVAGDESRAEAVEMGLSEAVPLRLLQGVGVLHRKGYGQVGIFPSISPNGVSWRLPIKAVPRCEDFGWETGGGRVVRYGTAGGTKVDIWEDHTRIGRLRLTSLSTPEDAANLILAGLGPLKPTACPGYEIWYAALLSVCEGLGALPISYADFYDRDGWEIIGYPDDYGGQIVFPRPPGA